MNYADNSFNVVTVPLDANGDQTIIDGVTIRAGNATLSPGPGIGAGMRIEDTPVGDGAAPRITNCFFEANSASSSGGGVYCGQRSTARFTACRFIGNRAASSLAKGGAMFCTRSATEFVRCSFIANASGSLGGAVAVDPRGPTDRIRFHNCLFENNAAELDGGAIGTVEVFITGGTAHLDIVNTIFTGNTTIGLPGSEPISGRGGAVFVENRGVSLVNCTLTANQGKFGGGVFVEGTGAGGAQQVANSILHGNNATTAGSQLWINATAFSISYSDLQGGFAAIGGSPIPGNYGAGNIDQLPLFNGAPSDLTLSEASPCLDVGENTPVPPDETDVDGDMDTNELIPDYTLSARITPDSPGARVDMGAHECFACPGDTNGDDTVDTVDFLRLLTDWGPGQSPADIAPGCGNGTVDTVDFLLLLQRWGPCPSSAEGASIQTEVEAAGLMYPADWNAFVAVMTDASRSEDERANWRCWMAHYLDCHGMAVCTECVFPICPDSDPFDFPLHW